MPKPARVSDDPALQRGEGDQIVELRPRADALT
jgi:hypothetical protein